MTRTFLIIDFQEFACFVGEPQDREPDHQIWALTEELARSAFASIKCMEIERVSCVRQ